MLSVSDEQLLGECLTVFQQTPAVTEPGLLAAQEELEIEPLVGTSYSTVKLKLPPEVLAFKEAKHQRLAQVTHVKSCTSISSYSKYFEADSFAAGTAASVSAVLSLSTFTHGQNTVAVVAGGDPTSRNQGP